MRVTILPALALLVSASYAFAGGGAPVPPRQKEGRHRVVPARCWMTPNVRPFGA